MRRMSRYDLTDSEWRVIEPLLPNKPRGVPRVDDRRVLNGIFWVLRSGASWRDLPERYGPRTTCLQSLCPMAAGRRLGPDHGRSNRSAPICFSPYLYRARNLVERFSTRSSTVAGSQRAMTSWRRTTSLSFSLRRSGYGCALMNPHPS
jgi:transposase